MRWRHPERGIVTPERFIGVAEDTGLIGRSGRGCCARRARRPPLAARSPARRCTSTSRRGRSPTRRCPAQVAETLAATGLPAEALVLEITESSLMDAGRSRRRCCASSRQLGVGLVLDDFGTGWSSLSRLRHLPITGLKVDRSFVAEMERGERAERADRRRHRADEPRARARLGRRGDRDRARRPTACASSAAARRRASCSRGRWTRRRPAACWRRLPRPPPACRASRPSRRRSRRRPVAPSSSSSSPSFSWRSVVVSTAASTVSSAL